MSHLEEMPLEVLETILSFVSNVQDFRHCELTSKKLHQLIAKDSTWRFCLTEFQDDPRLTTYREKACVQFAIQQVYKWQQNPGNILVGGMCGKCWKTLIQHSLLDFCLGNFPDHHQCELRGDTLGTLLEIVQQVLLEQLERANFMVCAIHNDEDDNYNDRYPRITRRHLQTQNTMQIPFFDKWSAFSSRFREAVDLVLGELNPTQRDTMIRQLAYRAGIVQLANDVYDYMWGQAVCLIVDLFRPALLYHLENYRFKMGDKRVLAGRESMATVAPFSEQAGTCDCGCGIYVHTPVPKQIEDAALALSIPSKVYGDVWVTTDNGMTEDEEREAAISRYEFEEEETNEDDERVAKRKFDEVDWSDDDADGLEN